MNTPPKLSFACPMPWTQMSGTERSRFCEKCGHHVRNLSLMSTVERAEILRCAQTERICGTYYVRLSGEMVTPEVPLTRTERSRLKQFGVAALSAGALALAAGCVTTPVKQSAVPPPATPVVNASENPPPAAVEKKDGQEDEIILLTGFIVEPEAKSDSIGYRYTGKL